MTPFFVVVTLFATGTPLATDIEVIGPAPAQQCVAEADLLRDQIAYSAADSRRTVRCMSEDQVNIILESESVCQITSPVGATRNVYICTGQVRK